MAATSAVPAREGTNVPERLWTRDYALSLTVAFLLSLVFYMLMTTMALYAAVEFGAGEVLAGLASSAFVLGAVSARMVAGAAADRFGLRRVLLIALVLALLASIAYFPVSGLGMLIAVRFIHGIVFSSAHTAASAITQSLIPSSRRAEGTGYHGATSTLGTAVGPLIAVLLVADERYDALFLSASVITAVALVAGLVLRAPQRMIALPPTRGRRRRLPIEPAAVPISSFILICAIAFSGVVAFVNPYAVSLGLESAAAAFFLVYAVILVASRPFLGRLQDVRGDDIVMYPGIVLFAGGLGVLAVTRGPVMLLVAAALIGLGWGTLNSAAQAVAVRRSPITSVGRTVSTYFLLLDAGFGIGPVVLGVVVGQLDYRWMYGVLVVVVILSGFYYRAVPGRSAAA